MKLQDIEKAVKDKQHIAIQTKCAELSHEQATPNVIFLYELASPTQRLELISELTERALRNTFPGIFTFYCQHCLKEEQNALLEALYINRDRAAGPFVSWLIVHGHFSITNLAVRTLNRLGDSRLTDELSRLEATWSKQYVQTFELKNILDSFTTKPILNADDPLYPVIQQCVKQYSDPTGWTYIEKRRLSNLIGSAQYKLLHTSSPDQYMLSGLATKHEANSDVTNLLEVIPLLPIINTPSTAYKLSRIWHLNKNSSASYLALKNLAKMSIGMDLDLTTRQSIHDKMPGLTTSWAAKMTLYTLTMPINPQPWIEAFDENKKGVQKQHILPLFHHNVSQDVLDRIEHYFKRLKPNIRRGHLRQLPDRFHPDHLPMFLNIFKTLDHDSRKILMAKFVGLNMVMDNVFLNIINREDEDDQVKLMALKGLKRSGTRFALPELHKHLKQKTLPKKEINKTIKSIQLRYPVSAQKQGGISLQDTNNQGGLSSVDASPGKVSLHDPSQSNNSDPIIEHEHLNIQAGYQLAAPPRKIPFIVQWTALTCHANRAGVWIIAAIATALFVKVFSTLNIIVLFAIQGCVVFGINLYKTKTLNHLKMLKVGFLGSSQVKDIIAEPEKFRGITHTVYWQVEDDNGQTIEFKRPHKNAPPNTTDTYPTLFTIDDENNVKEMVLLHENATLNIQNGHLNVPQTWIFSSLFVWAYLIGAIIALILV